jgi:hypothetical protein
MSSLQGQKLLSLVVKVLATSDKGRLFSPTFTLIPEGADEGVMRLL